MQERFAHVTKTVCCFARGSRQFAFARIAVFMEFVGSNEVAQGEDGVEAAEGKGVQRQASTCWVRAVLGTTSRSQAGSGRV